MKKFNSTLAIVAIALTSVFGFTSCEKDNDAFANKSFQTEQVSQEKPKYEESEQEKQEKIPVVFTTTSEIVFNDNAPANAGEKLAEVVKNYFNDDFIYATIDSKWENGKLSMQFNSNEFRWDCTETQLDYHERTQYDFSLAIQNLGFVKSFSLSVQGRSRSFNFAYSPKVNYIGTWEATDTKGTNFVITFESSDYESAGYHPGIMKVGDAEYTVNNFSGKIVCTLKGSDSKGKLSYVFTTSDTEWTEDSFAATLVTSLDGSGENIVFHRVK